MSESDLRQRATSPPNPSKPSTSPSNPSKPSTSSRRPTTSTEVDTTTRVISIADIVRIVLTLTGVCLALSYYMTSGSSVLYGYKPWFTRPGALQLYWRGPAHLTAEQLALFNGSDTSLPIYLAVNGTIFDVSAGRHTYGPGGSYAVFAGRDATRAFVTGCFLEDRTADLRGAEEVYLPIEDVDEVISSGQRKTRAERERREAKKKVLAEVKKWVDFYSKSDKYFEVGRLVGVAEPSGPAPTLCAVAQKGRPKRKKMTGETGSAAPGKPVQ